MHFALRAAFLIAFWAVVVTPCVHAQIPQTARSAFADGRFLIAAELAEAEGSAESLAFSARARIADAITRDTGLCGECLRQAEATAQAAVKRDADLAEGYIQLAVAIGLRGRLLDAIEAQSEGLAERGRSAIDRALELEPLNSWARAALGAWHLEIVRRAGSVLASILYGAREEEGLENFRKAVAANPGFLLIHYHFALSILALDPERFRGEALEALRAGAEDQRTDALTTFTRKRAEKLIERLKEGSPEAIATLVRRYQGYPDG
jgi:tetratricopeptide (TPR) repeat protein